MLTASWQDVESDVKLGVFLMTVAAQSLLPDHPVARQFGKAALGPALDAKKLAAGQADDLEHLADFDVSGTRFYRAAQACFDLVRGRTPLDEVGTRDFEDETLRWMNYFLSAIPDDLYATTLAIHVDRFKEHANRGDEFPLLGLHLAAIAKINLAEYLQLFPRSPEMQVGFAPFEIAALAGMRVASVRNFIGPDGRKPIRSMPSKDPSGVYGEPLGTLEWLAGRRNFDPGPLSSRWLEQAGDRAETITDAGAILGVYAWTNRITTEAVRNWTRGDLSSPEDAAPLAEAVGIDPEFYIELVGRLGGAVARI